MAHITVIVFIDSLEGLVCAFCQDKNDQQGVLCHQIQEQNALSRAQDILDSLPEEVKSAETQETFHKRCLNWLLRK